MLLPVIAKAVSRRLADESISVREAAVSLVGWQSKGYSELPRSATALSVGSRCQRTKASSEDFPNNSDKEPSIQGSILSLQRAATDEKESIYSAGLKKIAQRVIEEYGENSVATEVNLFNLILRSVGGHRDSLLGPQRDELEEMTTEEFDELIQTGLADMEEVPLATKLTAGQSEFRKIFSEFWYRLAQTS